MLNRTMLDGLTNKIINGIVYQDMLKKEKNKIELLARVQFESVLAVLDSLPEHIGVLDSSGVLVAANRSWTGYSAKNGGGAAERPEPGTNYLRMLKKHSAENDRSGRIWKNIVSVLGGKKDRFTMEYPSHRGRDRKWFLLSVTPMKTGAHVTGAVVSHTDITRRKLAELETKRFSVTDPMTGILNRKAGLESVQRQMKFCERHGCSFTVCYIDLDNLKRVNDSLGHKEGDRVIITLVNLLRGALRESDVMCRLGGDEILLILQETSLDGSAAVLKRIRESVDARNERSSKPYTIEFSYGIAEYSLGSGLTPDELVDIADRNMYKMKSAKKSKKGGNYRTRS
ncbi:MAG TPA: sensor domain-containing diguanylate cyclase [Thermodesulfobacteriota bacterium]|nr:sensor domain-containing diguanylate cyclase [Thermodesulfobacteriota bacterium]